MRIVPLVPTRRQLFIPLSVAAAILYRAFRTEGDQPPRTEQDLEKHIDEAAHAVSLTLRVYRMDLPDPVEIANATVAEGTFVGGALRLQFPDGRPPIESLGVNRIDLDRALAKRALVVPESRPEAIIPRKFIRPKL